jgi:hypothetical protein
MCSCVSVGKNLTLRNGIIGRKCVSQSQCRYLSQICGLADVLIR